MLFMGDLYFIPRATSNSNNMNVVVKTKVRLP